MSVPAFSICSEPVCGISPIDSDQRRDGRNEEKFCKIQRAGWALLCLFSTAVKRQRWDQALLDISFDSSP
jgi:hypothetical protein